MFENGTRAREFDSPRLVYGFFAGTGMFTIIFCLIVVALLTECGKGGGTPTTPPPPPPQNYEPLGTIHWLKDSAGQTTDMWARLPAEPNPPRGSTLPNGGGGAVAASVRVEIGIKNPGAKYGAYITGYWSHDGLTQNEEIVQIGECIGGECGSPKVVEAIIRQPDNRTNYRYILISGTQGVIPKDKRTGTANFFLDYR